MILSILNHDFRYETENVIRIFFPLEKINTIYTLPDSDTDYIITERSFTDDGVVMSCKVCFSGVMYEQKKISSDDEQEQELSIAQMLYDIFSVICDYKPSWGIVTGVRPAKLLRNLITADGKEKALGYFRHGLYVSLEKTELALAVADAEERIIRQSGPKSYSLYISIPFCPTRCSYCSFVSHSISQAKKLIPDYVRLLGEELKDISEIASGLGLELETIYFGGGTPTSLGEAELMAVTDAVGKYFDVSSVREYTIEAGRPDTLNEEKLKIMKNAGVNRISINPQTFNADVLKAIGRNHSTEMTEQAFEMARKLGFNNINMDFIAGLPTDTYESFCMSIDKAISMNPENITVHTLALKRAAGIVTGGEQSSVVRCTDNMLAYSNAQLSENGYFPYYMYRQSKSVGNNENVGWCRNEKECLYNIYMMEEVHTVLAAGGGAVTRLKSPYDGRIERIFNFKYPYEYINRFDEQSARKGKIAEFYKEIGF